MVRTISKRFLSLLLVTLMVLTLFPANVLASTEGSLDDPNIGVKDSGDGAWTLSGDTIEGTVTGEVDCNNNGSSKTGTLQLTNKKTVAAVLSFDYELTLDGGSATIGSSNVTESGSFSQEIASDAAVAVSITSAAGEQTTKIKITNISLVVDTDITTIFEPAVGGSYTVNGEAVTSSTSITQRSTVPYTLVASPASGMKFAGWHNVTNDTYPSASSTWNPMFDEPYTITPVFVPIDTPVFDVSKHFFTDLNDAVSYANSSGDSKITLISDGILPAGDYTIPSGKTLLIPFDEKQTLYTTDPGNVLNTYSTPTKFRELTMANGANLVVEGVLSLSANHSANANGGGKGGGAPSGPCSFLKLQSGASVTAVSGGTIYAYGYIYGDGTVTIKSGAAVYENMQIRDFRGGSAMLFGKNGFDQGKVFPLSQYFIQNVESAMTIEAGATETVVTSLYVSEGATTMSVPFIGNGGMFTISSGSVTKRYNPAKDKLEVTLDGVATINGMSLELSGVSIDSANYVLPINNALILNVNGEVTVNQSVEFHPGAEMHIAHGATVTIPRGNNIFAYDKKEWVSAGVFGGVQKVYWTASSRTARTPANEPSALIDINGTVNVSGGIYTTASGGNVITSEGTGMVRLINAPSSNTKFYYVTQSGSGASTKITPVEVPVTSAQLRNGSQYAGTDEEFTKTAGATAGKEYTWSNAVSKWVTEIDPVTIKFASNGAEGSMADQTVMPGDSFTFPANGFTVPEGHTFAGWTTPLTGDQVIPAGTPFDVPANIPVNEITLTAQWTPIPYTITFVNDDGTVLQSGDVAYGTVPTYTGETPAKAGTAEFSYTFAGWDKEVVAVTGEATYTATFTQTTNKYTIKFLNDDGTVISENEVAYGTAPTVPTAVKENTAQYTYTFVGWNNGSETLTEIPAVTGAATYQAVFTETLNKYPVKFVDEDGTVLQSSDVEYGTMPTAPADPSKDSTAQYDYSFSGWTPEIQPVTGEATYTAVYTETVRRYHVQFVWDNGVVSESDYDYGETPDVPEAPEKDDDAQYTYSFAGWLDESGEVVTDIPAVTGAATYTASYTGTVRSYTITFDVEGERTSFTKEYGTEISSFKPADPTKTDPTGVKQYTFVGWQVAAGSMDMLGENDVVTGDQTYAAVFEESDRIFTYYWYDGVNPEPLYTTTDVANQSPDYEGETPTKPGNQQYSYSFAGWQRADDLENAVVTFTAYYNETVNEYQVTFDPANGEEPTVVSVPYGETPVAPADPQKAETAQFTFRFDGWADESGTLVTEFPPVTGNVTYSASFSQSVRSYTVTWIIDGVEETEAYLYGAVPAHADPVKDRDAQHVYVFTGWDKEIEAVTGDVTYTAQFDAVLDGWQQDDAGLTYYVMGELQKTGLTTIDGQVYYLDEETGYAKTGWFQNGDGLYDWMFFDETTGAAETGSVTHHETINYFGEDTDFNIGYTFDETTHKLVAGTWVQYGANYRLRWANFFPTKTWIEQEGEEYYLNPSGFALRGVQPAPTPDGALNGLYVFDETTGAKLDRILGDDVFYTVEGTDRTYYLKNDLVNYSGLIEHDGAFYYVQSKDFTLVKAQEYKITKTNGLKPVGSYVFDAEGRMLDGIVSIDGQLYYFRDGVKSYEGLYVEYYDADGNQLPSADGAVKAVYYYFTSRTFEAVKGKTYYVTKNNDLLPKGYYPFDENGQYVVELKKDGIVEEDGQLYFYENGKKTYAGLVAEYYDANGNKLSGPDGAAKIVYYYFTSRTFEAVKGQSYYITKTNDLLPKGTYTFDENGQYVVVINRNGFVEENGQLYYYENGQKSYAGLVLGDDGYYYYFTSRTFEAVKGKSYYITKTNDLLPKGTYTFDENGRLVP